MATEKPIRMLSSVDRHRIQGWLMVANATDADCLDNLQWHRKYCILNKEERRLHFFNDTESVLLSSPPASPMSFVYPEADGQGTSLQKKVTDAFQRNTKGSRSFRDKMKSSFHKGVNSVMKKPAEPVIQQLSASTKVMGRSKSWGKADKVDLSDGGEATKIGHSMDNLHRVGSQGTPEVSRSLLGEHRTSVDLSTRGTLKIQVVHPSVSPRNSCFRVITETEILYMSSGSPAEMQKWAVNLNECQRPNRNHLRHLDTHLSVGIMEARNLVLKKRYFCEVYLNGILYAQSCCKAMSDMLFWGESFVFEELPALGTIVFKLQKENNGRKKKDKFTEVGQIELPALTFEGGQVTEKWYPLTQHQLAKSSSSVNLTKDASQVFPALRLKIQYHVITVQPLKIYDDLLKYLKADYSVVCDVLEPIISAKAKDEIAQTLVRILQVAGKAQGFLCDIVMAEVQEVENENLIFRGNTFATKAVDTYMKMVGEMYLHEALTPFICTLLETEEDCEVDPTKFGPNVSLQHNQIVLRQLVDKAWYGILSSVNRFPSDLRNTLSSIRQRFGTEREDACFKLISGSIFLRFLCPAILSPSLFQLCQEYPDEKVSRKLTLVAKVIQNLANFTRFGSKEEYMLFMNDFLEKETVNMKQYVDRISFAASSDAPVVEWGPCVIDLAKEASVMHLNLTSQIHAVRSQLSKSDVNRIEPLTTILSQITKMAEEAEGDPFSSTIEALRMVKSTISKFSSMSHMRVNSNSSSEYNTTPGESTPASPTAERKSPIFMSGTQINSGGEQAGSSHSNSPTGAGAIGQGKGENPEVVVTPSKCSPPLSYRQLLDPERRNSDSDVLRQRVKKRQASKVAIGSHDVPTSLDDHSPSAAELRGENFRLSQKVDLLMEQLTKAEEREKSTSEQVRGLEREKSTSEQVRGLEQENDQLRRNTQKLEQELRGMKESRGKVLRGLHTQAEVTTLQVKKDMDNLQRQITERDEEIQALRVKVVTLTEVNLSLINTQQLRRTSNCGGTENDHNTTSYLAENLKGRNGSDLGDLLSPGSDLGQMISQLGSGKFEVR